MSSESADLDVSVPALLISTPSYPANGAYVNIPKAGFSWVGVSTAVAQYLVGNSYYTLQIDNDIDFTSPAVILSTPIVLGSTSVYSSDSSIAISTHSLSNATTYYWRVFTVTNGLSVSSGPYSSTFSFVTDFSSPTASGYTILSSSGGWMSESQMVGLFGNGATVRINVADAISGLAVSTAAIWSGNDSHNWGDLTGGFSVKYTTSAGANWVEGAGWKASNGGAVVVSGQSSTYSLAAYKGRLYAGVYSQVGISTDGVNWSQTTLPGNPAHVKSLTAYNNNLYAGTVSGKVFVLNETNDTWSAINGGNSIGGSVGAMAVYNGRLYAAIDVNKVAVFDGTNWSLANNGNPVLTSELYMTAMAVYNGKLYTAGYSSGKVAVFDGTTWGLTNDGNALFTSLPSVMAFAVYNGKLYIGCNGKVSVFDGANWTTTNSGAVLFTGANLTRALAVYNGKLYANTGTNGKMAVFDGTNWTVATANTATTGITYTEALVVYNNQLYIGGDGKVSLLSPSTMTLTGADGTTDPQTLSAAASLNLVQSTNTQACNGSTTCGATNQVVFNVSDMAGNVRTYGPYAVQVDLSASQLYVATPSWPVNGAFVSFPRPNFSFIGVSTNTGAMIGAGSYYYVDYARDENFTTVEGSTTSALLLTDTNAFTLDGAPGPTTELANNTTYYWRVRIKTLINSNYGINISTGWFVTDFSSPTASGYTIYSSTNGQMSESQVINLANGVTAQITVTDARAGLAVSTSALWAGGGQMWGDTTSGFSVNYTTSAGANWLEGSSWTVVNGGPGAWAMAVYNGILYASVGPRVTTFNGTTWTASNGNNVVIPAPGNEWIQAMAVYKGNLYVGSGYNGGGNGLVGVFNGTSWSVANSTLAVVPGGGVLSFAVYNNKLYAGTTIGKIGVFDGTTWQVSNSGNPVITGAASIHALAVYNGKLYAGDWPTGKVAVFDGINWSMSNSGASIGSYLAGFVVYNGNLYARNSGSYPPFRMFDGTSWSSPAAQPPSLDGNTRNSAMTVYNGKLYTGGVAASPDSTKVAVFNGKTWAMSNNGAPVGINWFQGFVVYNDRLYAATGNSLYVMSKTTATLAGADGTTVGQTLAASGSLNLVQSTSSVGCGGVANCGATNQVVFNVTDMAGNVGTYGPYAVVVDSMVSGALELATPTWPVNGAFVNFTRPNFSFVGVSTNTAAILGSGAKYQVDYGTDPGFGLGTYASTSTFVVVVDTNIATVDGAPGPNSNLIDATTYYWRVLVQSGAGTYSVNRSTGWFITDFTAPVASAFSVLNSTGGAYDYRTLIDLINGVTAQINVIDAAPGSGVGSGLAVSASSLWGGSDGHVWSDLTSGYSVKYSSTAGAVWTAGTWNATNGGAAVTSGASTFYRAFSAAVFNNKIYIGDQNGRVFWTANNGVDWTASNGGSALPGNGGSKQSAAVFNNKLYFGDQSGYILESSDGGSWSVVNGGAPLDTGTPAIYALAVYNGRLYAGANNGKVYFSANGSRWSTGVPVANFIGSLVVYNGRLYAADQQTKKVYVSVDGVTWTAINGNAIVSATALNALAVYNGRLYAGDNGRVYESSNGDTWTGGIATGNNIVAGFTTFNGKIYAPDAGGRVFESADPAVRWNATNSGAAITGGDRVVCVYNNKIYTGGDGSSKIHAFTPTPATLTGTDGTTTAQTLTATGLSMAQTTNTYTCNGAFPCGATNQVIFNTTDRAGNVTTYGPFSVQVDIINSGIFVATPAWPVNGAFVNLSKPNFNFVGISTNAASVIGNGARYVVEYSADANFSVVGTTSTLLVLTDTNAITVDGAIGPNASDPNIPALADNTTYYWRVKVKTILSTYSMWISTGRFITDFTQPVPTNFKAVSFGGALMSEGSFVTLARGVTAQITVTDATGLAVSTYALSSSDGHDWGDTTAGFNVKYTTNSGANWIEGNDWALTNGGSTILGGTAIRALVSYKGKLYAGVYPGGKIAIFDDATGTWTAYNSGAAILGASYVYNFAVYNGYLYAGTNNGKVAKFDGTNWTDSLMSSGVSGVGEVESLAVYNGKLYAGYYTNGKVAVFDGTTWRVSNNNNPIISGGPLEVDALGVYNGKLYAGNERGQVAIFDGANWTMANGGAAILGAGSATSLTAYNGNLYLGNYSGSGSGAGAVFNGTTWAATPIVGAVANWTERGQSFAVYNGKLYEGTWPSGIVTVYDGTTRSFANRGTPVFPGSGMGGAPYIAVTALTAHNGKLYAASDTGLVAVMSPSSVTLSGFDGTTGVQTLTVAGSLNLAHSTNTSVCNGSYTCGATNQVVFNMTDMAGNVKTYGPFAISVDIGAGPLAVATPTWPVNGVFVNFKRPNFSFIGMSTNTAAMITGAQYQVDWGKDQNFGSYTSTSMAVVLDTNAFTMDGSIGPNAGSELVDNTTYYWRVRVKTNYNNYGVSASTGRFITDFTIPAVSAYQVMSADGASLNENQPTTLFNNVTAQITVTDAAGLAVSTSAIWANDAHSWSDPSAGFSVKYTTSAGANWLEDAGWTVMNGGDAIITGANRVEALAVYNGKLYAGTRFSKVAVLDSSTGSWTVANNGNAVLDSGDGPLVFAVYNGKLYGSGTNGKVAQFDGTDWTVTNNNTVVVPGATIMSLAVYNDKLYAGTNIGKVTVFDGNTWSVSNNGNPVSTGAQYVAALGVYNGKLYAGTNPNGKVAVFDGTNWSQANGGVGVGGTAVTGWAVYNGKLYGKIANNGGGVAVFDAATGVWSSISYSPLANSFNIGAMAVYNGKLYTGYWFIPKVAVYDGTNWTTANNNAAITTGINLLGMAVYEGKLYVGMDSKVIVMSPSTATLTGYNGTTGGQTLAAFGSLNNLVQSTNTLVCGGVAGCGATNQVIFSASDMAGNVRAYGPYAVQVNIGVGSLAIATPTWPINGAYVNFYRPNFNFIGVSTTAAAMLGTAAQYQVDYGTDQSFGSYTSTSMAIVLADTNAFTVDGVVGPNVGLELADKTTYYWRVRVKTIFADYGINISTGRFITDFAIPAASAFQVLSSTNGWLGESQAITLTNNVTAQITVTDAAGLAVSTSALWGGGGGLNWGGYTGGFSVKYTTSAGANWVDNSTWTISANAVITGATGVYSFAVYNGTLYGGMYPGKVAKLSSATGIWSEDTSFDKVALGLGDQILSFAVYNNELYAGSNNGHVAIFSGTSWRVANNGNALSGAVETLAVYNGRLYAGTYPGKVYAFDGSTWSVSNNGNKVITYSTGGDYIVNTLCSYNGRLYLGANWYQKLGVFDGSTWTTTTADGGDPQSFAVYNGKLYSGGDNFGKVGMFNGASWSVTNGGNAVFPAGGRVTALIVYKGKLYAFSYAGNVAVFDGTNWTAVNNGTPVIATTTALFAVAVYDDKLYVGNGTSGKVAVMSPAAVTLTGGDGTTNAQTLSAAGSLNLAQSTNTAVCGGVANCGATNQVVFNATDLAGNVLAYGPYAVQVDYAASSPLMISTPSYPANGAVVGTSKPGFSWIGANTTFASGIGQGANYNLEISRDPSFASFDVRLSTPVVVVSTMIPTVDGYIVLSTHTLSDNTTYYWRVRAQTALGNYAPFISTFSFMTDVTAPQGTAVKVMIPGTGFVDVNAIYSPLAAGLTVQFTLEDPCSGLALSTASLDNLAGGISVFYSSTSGNSWRGGDWSALSGGAAIPIFGGNYPLCIAVYQDKLYVGLSNGTIVYLDGAVWSGANGGSAPLVVANTITSMRVLNNRLYVINDSGYIGYLSGTTWTNLGRVAPYANRLGPVNNNSITAYGPGLYVSNSDANWVLLSSAMWGAGGWPPSTSYNGRAYFGWDGGPSLALNIFDGKGINLWAPPWTNANYARSMYTYDAKLMYGGQAGQIRYNHADNSYLSYPGSTYGFSTLYRSTLLYAYRAGTPNAIRFAFADEKSVFTSPMIDSAMYYAQYQGKLYAFHDANSGVNMGKGLVYDPLRIEYTGGDGSKSSLVTAYGFDLRQTTNTVPCNGAWSCAATNQVLVVFSDLAGNVNRYGPYSVLVDYVPTSPLFIATPIWPVNGAYVNIKRPNLSFIGISTTAANSLGLGAQYQVDYSLKADFSDIPVSTSTPLVVADTNAFTVDGAIGPNVDLADSTTYYWRVRVKTSLSTFGINTSTGRFITDFTVPAGSAYQVLSSTNGWLSESQSISLTNNVTAQITITDATGLAVSSAALWSGNDGHDWGDYTSGFSVKYTTSAGVNWVEASTWASTGFNSLTASINDVISLAVYNGELYVGSYPSKLGIFNGTSWRMANNNNMVFSTLLQVKCLAVYNGNLYAGSTDPSGQVAKFDGTTWSLTNNGAAIAGTTRIWSLAVYNGKLYAGLDQGKVAVFDGTTWSVTNNGNAIYAGATGVYSLAVYNGKLYAGIADGEPNRGRVAAFDGANWSATTDIGYMAVQALTAYNGKLYAGVWSGVPMVYNGITWDTVNGGQAILSGISRVLSFAVYNGKLYAGTYPGGRVAVFDGTTWSAANSNKAILSGSNASGTLAVYNGKLYSGTDNYQVAAMSPSGVNITGINGTTGAQTLSATGSLNNLVQSTNTIVCNSMNYCGATNQVVFNATDLAGNVQNYGPYSVIVDYMASSPLMVSTPSYPADGASVRYSKPGFSWIGISTVTAAILGGSAQYILQVDNDSDFSSPTVILNKPIVVYSTTDYTVDGFIQVTTHTLTDGTYYWRVAAQSGVSLGQWSAVRSFILDTAKPAFNNYKIFSSTAGLMSETQLISLTGGVTVQVDVQDLGSGLAVSSKSVLTALSGSAGSDFTNGFGVMYSTNAGTTWIHGDWDTVDLSALLGTGCEVTNMVEYQNDLYLGQSGGCNKMPVYNSATGNWGVTTLQAGLVGTGGVSAMA
ncbi:MAG: PQQ-binding-like beta-propeller repeat protein, partial [Elusimicrobiota bacterium]